MVRCDPYMSIEELSLSYWSSLYSRIAVSGSNYAII
ncbi:hypothetical protein [Salmonella phage SD-2_S15]|nr:hypothetical protein [Salmonella phage SD-2_S15]WPK18997.1 hypothetical protein [Salmonella phage SD-6_S16]WPK20692.1 hypothetical protein [Salmonella phage SD-15_S21]